MYNPEKHNHKEIIIRKAEALDVPLILDLLTKNLARNLSEEEKKDGFFHFEPTYEELLKIINDTGVYLSLRGEELKGYFITMSKELAQTIPFEAEMLANAERMLYEGKPLSEYNYVVLAQICVAKEFRGGMTFNRLHLATQSILKEQGFEIGFGEIEDTNSTSLAVHSYLTDVGTYIASSGLKWHIMVSDLRKD
ncbi:MAG: hypothetical protein V4664_02790 [Patescibacteria group bacterium]